MNKVYRALADPTRRRILELLRERDMSAGELAEHFPLAKPTLSRHFAILKEQIDSGGQGRHYHHLPPERDGAGRGAAGVDGAVSNRRDEIVMTDNATDGKRGLLLRLVLVSLVFLLLMLLITALAWGRIPAGQVIPIHWGISGKADAFAPKTTALVQLPIVLAVLSAVLLIIFALVPTRDLPVQSVKAFTAIIGVAYALLVLVQGVIIHSALGHQVNMTTVSSSTGRCLHGDGQLPGKIRQPADGHPHPLDAEQRPLLG